MASTARTPALTGVEGLDDILSGGLPRGQFYLVQGDPGVGKTTLALQFLLEGARHDEPGVYVTLSESQRELEAVAAGHGWSLDKVAIYELEVAEETARGDYTLFHPAEVELSHTTRGMLEMVERIQPVRLVLDSLSELRLLARDPLRYRRQVLALKQFFAGRDCTVLLIDDRSSGPTDLQLESITHGVIDLEQLAPDYGPDRRRVRVKKLRGVHFRSGYHDCRIVTGGLMVFPHLVAGEHQAVFMPEPLSSGVAALDELLGGGIDRGSSTLVIGPAGSGKSSLALQYVLAAVARGQHAAFFAFEEGLGTLRARSRSLGWDLQGAEHQGRLHLQQVNPAELTPGEFSYIVRQSVERDDARVVVIDSLNAYLSAMPAERYLGLHLHELNAFLNRMGVATIMVMAQHGLLGRDVEGPVPISYLADCVILLRYFEHGGALRQAVSVVKKRSGPHQRDIREFGLGWAGVHVGAPLVEYKGVLTGVPAGPGPVAEPEPNAS